MTCISTQIDLFIALPCWHSGAHTVALITAWQDNPKQSESNPSGCTMWKKPLFMSAFDNFMVSMHSMIWESDCFAACRPQCLYFLQQNPVNASPVFPMSHQCMNFFLIEEGFTPIKLSMLTVQFNHYWHTPHTDFSGGKLTWRCNQVTGFTAESRYGN